MTSSPRPDLVPTSSRTRYSYLVPLVPVPIGDELSGRGQQAADEPTTSSQRNNPLWSQKIRWATSYRLRQVHLDGHCVSRDDLARVLGWDPAQLIADGQRAMAAGCPTCGRVVEPWRVQLRLIDRCGPPLYTNARWRVFRCGACTKTDQAA